MLTLKSEFFFVIFRHATFKRLPKLSPVSDLAALKRAVGQNTSVSSFITVINLA